MANNTARKTASSQKKRKAQVKKQNKEAMKFMSGVFSFFFSLFKKK